jgi:precorrin-6B methylase 2
MEIMGKAPRSSHYAETAGIFTAFFYRSKPYQAVLQSLDRDARRIAPYLIARMPLSRSRTLLDVGGGLGTFALACCRRLFPQLRATIVEHPRVVPITHHAVKNAKMAKRGQVIGLDFVKDPLPRGFDLVLISNVFHGQGAKENRALLTRAYRSLNQGGRIILRDVLMSRAGTHPDWGALFSVSHLMHTPNAAVTRWMKWAAGSVRRDSRVSKDRFAPARCPLIPIRS